MSNATRSGQRTADSIRLPALLERWVAEGLITEDQQTRILATEERVAVGSPGPPRLPSSLVAEALAYVGGVVILVGALSLGSRYWSELQLPGRLALVGGATLVLYGAGELLGRRGGGSATRMRAVTWLAATASLSGCLALVGADALGWPEDDVVLLTAAGTAVGAAALWWRSPVLPQQAAFFVASMLTAAFLVRDVTETSSWPGVAAWCVAVAWFVLGWRGVVAPREAVLPLSGAAAVIAAIATTPGDAGLVLALVTAGALVAVAVALRDLVLMAVGALGLFQAVPGAIAVWFPDTVAAPIVLLAVGLALVLLAVRTGRHGRGTDR
jgi:hypothetical protein